MEKEEEEDHYIAHFIPTYHIPCSILSRISPLVQSISLHAIPDTVKLVN